MINSFHVKNFKAFKDASIEIKPITILLGTNSSGKSSLMQLILLLKQTINHQGQLDSALKINGEDVSLGEPINLLRNKNIKNNEISISISINSSDFNRWLSSIKEDIIQYVVKTITELSHFNRLVLDYTQGKRKEKDRNIFYDYNPFFKDSINPRIRFKSESQLEEETFDKILTELRRIARKSRKLLKDNGDQIQGLTKEKKTSESLFFPDTDSLSVLKESEISEIKHAFNLYSAIEKELGGKISVEFLIRYVKVEGKKTLRTEGLKVSFVNKTILHTYYERGSGRKPIARLESDIFDNVVLDKFRNIFWRNIEFDTILPFVKGFEHRRLPRMLRGKIGNEFFVNHIYKFFDRSVRFIERSLHENRITHVSPLRAFPKRYYFLDEGFVSGTSINSIVGDDLAATLKTDKTIKKKANDWLSKFGFSINVNDLESIIHQLKVNQNGVSLDITDVGFGLSQVLPIIVQGFLSKPGSLTLVEQPEIHLHPKMQAELADLFIDAAFSQKTRDIKSFIIETHSEYLLKRLRRRMAEGDRITSNDVAIYFIHGRKGKTDSARIERLEIDERGAFDWPTAFYETDMEDTVEFIKHQ